MDCAELQEDLCAYVDNELEFGDRLRVEEHLSACEYCAEEVASFRTLKSLVARVRLYDEDAPGSICVLSDEELAFPPKPATAHFSWLHRPVRARSVVLAAAAVFFALFVSWREYEARYLGNVMQREAVMAHLHAVAAALPAEPNPMLNASLRPIDDKLYAQPEGLVNIGHIAAFQTAYFVGSLAISQLRFSAGDFDDSHFQKQTAGGREYRVGRLGEYSIASYRRGPVQIVLVSSVSPEALLVLAQKLPPDTPFDFGGTGY
jgi:anti-sigma factor RsiW